MSIQLLTSREAAAFLRLRPQTLARWRVEGRGPAFVRIGGRVFYERAELERFVLAGRRHSTSDLPDAEGERASRIACGTEGER